MVKIYQKIWRDLSYIGCIQNAHIYIYIYIYMYVCLTYAYMWFHLKNTKCYMSICFLLFSLNLRRTFNLNWGTGEEVGTVVLQVVQEKQNCCYPYVGNRCHTMNKNLYHFIFLMFKDIHVKGLDLLTCPLYGVSMQMIFTLNFILCTLSNLDINSTQHYDGKFLKAHVYICNTL